MLKRKNLLISYKLLFALLGFSAIITEIATIAERGRFNPVNFFSFFTIESNILVVITFILSALAIAAGKAGKFDQLRSAVTVYILIVGIGFSVLLAGIEGIVLTAVPWDNTVLHYIIPVVALIDLIIDRPRTRLSFKRSLAWLLFPVLYGVYSLVRGSLTGWYPYPFLNPATSGVGGVVVAIGGLVVLGTALTWVVCKLSGTKSKVY